MNPEIVSEPQVLRVTKLSGRTPADPVRAVVEAKVNGLTLRGLKLELHHPHHWRLVPPGRKVQQQWQIVYDFSTRSVYDSLLRKVVTAYGGELHSPELCPSADSLSSQEIYPEDEPAPDRRNLAFLRKSRRAMASDRGVSCYR